MTMLISFLPNFIGRRDCNAGGRHCDVEQLGARLAHTQEVAGSIPAVATVIPHKTDLLAGQRRRAHPTHFFTGLPVEIRGVLVYDGRKCMRGRKCYGSYNSFY